MMKYYILGDSIYQELVSSHNEEHHFKVLARRSFLESSSWVKPIARYRKPKEPVLEEITEEEASMILFSIEGQ